MKTGWRQLFLDIRLHEKFTQGALDKYYRLCYTVLVGGDKCAVEQQKLEFEDFPAVKKDKKVAWRRFAQYNAKGELLSDTVTSRPRRLEGEWVVFYKKPLKQLAISAPPLSVLRIYLYLASKQTFETYVIVTPSKIMQDLGMAKRTFYDGIKYLKENGYVQQHEHDGNIAWLLNPTLTTRGRGNNAVKNTLWSLTNKEARVGQAANDVSNVATAGSQIVDRETGEILKQVDSNS